MIREQLRQGPGLHLVANYQGGVSVRERIYQGMKTAQLIAKTCESQLPATSDNSSHIGTLASANA